MSSTLIAFLTSWDLRIEILLPLILGCGFYARGWKIIKKKGRRRLSSRWQLASFLVGQLVVAVSLMSAIDSFSALLFFMHMIQHLLLIMIAAPLVLLANPFPLIIWGMPGGSAIARALFSRRAPLRQLLLKISGPGPAWMFLVVCLWGWHDPVAYDAALKSDLVHDLEHLTFYIAALFFWWHVIQTGPHIHHRLPASIRILYAASIVPANMIAGLAISFAKAPIYDFYTTVPRIWGLSALEDQQLGGTIMWIPGSMMYLLAAIILIAAQDRKKVTRVG